MDHPVRPPTAFTVTSQVPTLPRRPKPGGTRMFFAGDEYYKTLVKSKPWPSTVGNPTEAVLIDQGTDIRDFAVEAGRKTPEEQRKRQDDLRAQEVDARDFCVEAEERKAAIVRDDARRIPIELRENKVVVQDFAEVLKGKAPIV